MKTRLTLLAVAVILAATLASLPRAAAQLGRKDYLSDVEADRIRDAATPAARIRLYLSFADDRLKKFEYELNRKVPEERRSDILNGLLNGYSGCMDDAADQIDVAKDKQADIHKELDLMISKDKEFLATLQKLEQNGPELDTYKDTLEDAIDGTKDAISDAQAAKKEMLAPPVRRKQ